MDTVILVADASQGSGAAAEWTGLRARITGPAVRILEFGDTPAGRSPADVARDRIRELAPGTPVSVEHLDGNPVDVLCDLAGEATLVVVGGVPADRRGKPGSLPARLAGRIRCDLVVVPADWHPDGGPVVAGWDDTPESAHAPACRRGGSGARHDTCTQGTPGPHDLEPAGAGQPHRGAARSRRRPHRGGHAPPQRPQPGAARHDRRQPGSPGRRGSGADRVVNRKKRRRT